MADPLVTYDLEFHFTHGEPLYVTVPNQDAIAHTPHCTHCGRADETTVTVTHGNETTTLTIHRDKLNGVRQTTRIETHEPTLEDIIESATAQKPHGDTILELNAMARMLTDLEIIEMAQRHTPHCLACEGVHQYPDGSIDAGFCHEALLSFARAIEAAVTDEIRQEAMSQREP